MNVTAATPLPVRRDEQFGALGVDIPMNLFAVADAVRRLPIAALFGPSAMSDLSL